MIRNNSGCVALVQVKQPFPLLQYFKMFIPSVPNQRNLLIQVQALVIILLIGAKHENFRV